jgi:hypothetical protein
MQNLLTNSLKAIAKKDFFTEKILICPSFGTGSQILESFSMAKNNWINFKVRTIQSMAADLAEEEICERNLKKISMTETVFLIDRIFTESAELGQFKYFEKHTLNTGIISAISSSLMELKFAGIGHLQIEDRCFINQNKAKDLRQIYSKYEAALKENALIDAADLIVMATGLFQETTGKRKYIALVRHDYKKIEKTFLTACCGSDLIVVDDEKAFNFAKPKNRLMATDIPGISDNSTGNSCINTLDPTTTAQHRVVNAEIELFCAQNYRDEIYAILSRLVSTNTAVDDAQIIYTRSVPYLDIIHNLCRRLNIPVTFSAGLPGEKSSCGKALKGFLLWIKEDFPELHLRNMFKYGLLKINYGRAENDTFGTGSGFKINGFSFAHALRESKIGWGRQRYIPVLEKSIADIKIKLETGRKNTDYCRDRIRLLENLKEYVSKLLYIIPEINNGKVDFTGFCNCCLAFLSDFVSAKNENEASFLSNFKERLKTLELVTGNEVFVEEALQKVFLLIKDARFLSSGPKPGSLFVSDLAGGGLSGRNSIYIVGMDDNKFPGSEIQDPILLDEEREKTSSCLSLSKGSLKEKLYDFTTMLAAVRGKVTFSFSVFDLKAEKNLFASSELLQIYRLKTGRPGADYDELLKYLGQPEGYGQDHDNYPPVDKNYLWLSKLLSSGRLKDARDSILNIYPGLKNGIEALSRRSTSALTCFDGFIGSDDGRFAEKLDPRKNGSFVLSCTGIEMYAKSPFAFFLAHVLGVKRPEEIKKDPTLWLDSKNKGSLLHEVFQDFTDQMINSAGSPDGYPDTEKQGKIMDRILQSVIEKYRQEIPFPGISVFNSEILQLKKDTDIFIEVNDKLGNPYLAEFEFGCNGKAPVRISVGKDLNKKESYIHLAGRVDRVDFDLGRTNEYHVWDYKTGSSYGYEEDGFVSKGSQLQHVLYAKVIEEFLKNKDPDIRVTKCGYIFPTRKGRDSGKGCIMERDPGKEQVWQAALNCILDLISAGVFIFSEEINPPFSDDDDIFGSSADKKNIKEKLNNIENEVLEKWKSLKEFK